MLGSSGNWLTAAAVALVLQGAACATQAEGMISFDLIAQPLGDALVAIANQTDTNISVDKRLIAGMLAPTLKANMSLEGALAVLLQGTGLKYRFINEHTVVVEPLRIPQTGGVQAVPSGSTRIDDTVSLEEVIVAGRLIDTVSMMKRGETMRETPQSVTIMTQQRIEEQKLVSISEVMDQAPGMTVERDFYYRPTMFYSRGFEVSNIQVDGISAGVNRSTRSSRNLAMYEQVEILRGADGLFAGSGDPGGTVNLARKRGLDRPQALFNASMGRWNNFQVDLDVTGPLAFDGRLRGRAVAQWQDREYFYDTAQSSGRFFYATAEMDVTDSTLLVVGGHWGKNDEVPWLQGVPRYLNGKVLPGWTRERSLIADWNTWEEQPSEFFARLEQQLGERWRVTLSASREELDLVTNYLIIGAADPITGLTNEVRTLGYGYDSGTDSFDLSVQGKFDFLGRTHSVLLGYDGYESGTDAYGIRSSWATPLPSTIDPLDFRADTIPRPDSLSRTFREIAATTQQGVYGRVQLHLAEPFKLILGGRYSSYEYRSDVWWSHNPDGSVGATSDSVYAYKEDAIFTPYASALYDLNRQWTVYANITEIHKTQADLFVGPPPGKPMDSIRGRSYELGTKADLHDGRLAVSFALYHIEQTGAGEQDPAYPYSQDNSGRSCCYVDVGELVSQGIDTEVSGELLPGWSVFGGYTFNENENKRADAPLQTLSPKHIFKLWTSYRIPAAEQKWLVGGGVTVQSRRAGSGWTRPYNPESGFYDGPWTPFEITQGGYAVWNAMASYRINSSWQLALNANNLLDKTYFGAMARDNRYAEPRNFILTMRGRF